MLLSTHPERTNGRIHHEASKKEALPIIGGVVDLDGTIANTVNPEGRAMRFVMGYYYGKTFTTEDYHRHSGLGNMFDVVGKEFDLGVPSLDLKRKVHYHTHKLTGRELQLLPGAKDFLITCKDSNLPLAIATSTYRKNMYDKVDRADLYPYISAFAAGDEVKKGKPNPEIVNLALYRLNVSANQSFYAGDTEHDAWAAFNAGISPENIYILHNPFTPHKDLPMGVVIIDNLREVIPALSSRLYDWSKAA